MQPRPTSSSAVPSPPRHPAALLRNSESRAACDSAAAAAESVAASKPLLNVIGAGNYASRMLIPAFAKAGACFHTLAASSGIGPVHVGRKFSFRQASTDIPALLADPAPTAW